MIWIYLPFAYRHPFWLLSRLGCFRRAAEVESCPGQGTVPGRRIFQIWAVTGIGHTLSRQGFKFSDVFAIAVHSKIVRGSNLKAERLRRR